MIRGYLFFAMINCLSIAFGEESKTPRPIVGAIRWDAWHGDQGGPGRAMQHALGPAKWHGRLPFFAKVLGDDKVVIDGSAQEIMDKEIGYAKSGGLDYWAFVTYSANEPMSLGLTRYLSSERRGDIAFSLVTECGRWADTNYIERIVSLIQEPGYQTVIDGRPLIYLGFIYEATIRRGWTDANGFRKVLDEFRQKVVTRGKKNPYIVVMDFHAEPGKKWVESLGCDALGSYAPHGGGSAVPYSKLAGFAENFWNQCKAKNVPVVPTVMAGWDRRPRVERPVPWEPGQKPGVGIENFYQAPTPEELAAHVQRGVDWVRANSTHAPAQAILIYAWNENDEGGWLVPTLSEGDARLRAIGKVLRK